MRTRLLTLALNSAIQHIASQPLLTCDCCSKPVLGLQTVYGYDGPEADLCETCYASCEAAWHDPEHLAYLDDLARNVGA